jgi:hypothetical protein
MRHIVYREDGGRRHDSRGLVVYYSGDTRASVRLGVAVHQPRMHTDDGWVPFDAKVGKAVALSRWTKSPLVVQVVSESAQETPELAPPYVLRIVKMILLGIPMMTWVRSDEIPLIPNQRDVMWKSRCFGPDGAHMLELSTQGRPTRFVGQVPSGKNKQQYIRQLSPHPWLNLFPSWVPGFAEGI